MFVLRSDKERIYCGFTISPSLFSQREDEMIGYGCVLYPTTEHKYEASRLLQDKQIENILLTRSSKFVAYERLISKSFLLLND